MKSPQQQSVLILHNNPVKQYAWGCTSKQCQVSRFSDGQQCQYYAELWMGIHPNGQSSVRLPSPQQQPHYVQLSEFLQHRGYSNPEFLFKILSIQKCLSIQVHPNKEQAARLHQESPGIYCDSNDKPEIFYTLTPFQLFLGYAGNEDFIRIKNMGLFKQMLEQCATPRQMILAILSLTQQQQQKLLTYSLQHLPQIHPQRYAQQPNPPKLWQISHDFPGDIGIVVSFLLGYQRVGAGQCIFIDCNTPHAYISGEGVELMKNSDNVCRLGLTPKLKDMRVLAEVLGEGVGSSGVVEAQNKDEMGFWISQFRQNGLTLRLLSQDITVSSSKPQVLPIEPCKTIRILIVLDGSFHIAKTHQQPATVTSPCILLLQPNITYYISSADLASDSRLCMAQCQF